jgi:hypothetical protein
MRTTLTLDDDVAAALDRLRTTNNASLKVLVNQALQEGLKQLRARPRRREPFRTEPVALGPLGIGSIDNVAEAISVAEAPGCAG